jgi:hypothetical protein
VNDTDTGDEYQNFILYFTGVRFSAPDISLYNPDFSTKRNPYQRISITYLGQALPKTFVGDFCIVFTVQHYSTNEWLQNVNSCHSITLPKMPAYPYILVNALAANTSLDSPSLMRVEYKTSSL